MTHEGTGTQNTGISRPLVTPEAYNGESDASWDEWIEHFESVSRLNAWDKPTKLLWLTVRLTGKAQTAWRRFSDDTKADYDRAKEALRKRFEPESRRELYAAEFRTRTKQSAESWGELADNLRTLADKAFPELQDKAKDQLSLDRFLSLLDHPELSLAVRKDRPKTLEDAVATTLEVEAYLSLRPKQPVSGVKEERRDNPGAVGGSNNSHGAMLEIMQSMIERMDRLEKTVSEISSHSRPRGYGVERSLNRSTAVRDRPVICNKCGLEGHFARGCAAGRRPPQTGN